MPAGPPLDMRYPFVLGGRWLDADQDKGRADLGILRA
jgi:hypothetical protein